MNLHIDLTNGIEVSTLLAALLDTNIVSQKDFFEQFNKLPIASDVDLSIRDEYDEGKKSTKITIIDRSKLRAPYDNQRLQLKDIVKSFVACGISQGAELLSVKIFEMLSSAYSAVSDVDELSDVLDNETVSSILAFSILFNLMKINRVSVSNINVGSGVVVKNRNIDNVPTAVTKYLLKRFVTFGDDREGELTGVAAAAVINTIVNSETTPVGAVTASGAGLCNKLYSEHSNLLKVRLYADTCETNEDQPMLDISEKNYGAVQADSSALEGPFKKIDKIMRAMEDLEASLKASAVKQAARQNEKQPAEATSKDADNSNAYEEISTGHDAILDKIKQIEERLKGRRDADTAVEAEKFSPAENVFANQAVTPKNSSLEKFERLQKEAGLYDFNRQVAATSVPTKNKTYQSQPEKIVKTDEKHGVTGTENHSIIEITSNIDNSTGEELGFLAELIMANGAYDVYFESIYTNSFKPAYKLSAIIDAKDLSLFSKLILLHSGTVRVKYTNLNTIDLKSTTVKKSGKYGDVHFERYQSHRGDVPHFIDKKEIAKKYDLTLKEVDKILGEDYE